MANPREMTVTRPRRPRHVSAGFVGDGLMTEAHAEQRRGGAAQHRPYPSEIAADLRAAWPGRDNDAVDVAEQAVAELGIVVGHDHRFGVVDLRDELEQVERVRIVVVDEESAHVLVDGRPLLGMWKLLVPTAHHPQSVRCDALHTMVTHCLWHR